MDRALAAFDALAKHPRLDALATLVADELRVLVGAAPPATWPASFKGKVEALALGDDAATPFGDLKAILSRGPESPADVDTLAALSAHALAAAPPSGDAAETKLASELMWLAAHTPFGALTLVDRAFGEELADPLWGAIAARIRRIDASGVARAEALVGAAALGASPSKAAKKLAARLRREVSDRWVKAALGRDEGSVLDGELGPAPRSLLATTLLALTGLLFVTAGARLFARLALALRRPATVSVSPQGIEIAAKTQLLGRTLREQKIRIDRASLVRAEREIRYPRLVFYAGLLALALGSYVGVALLLDGTRAASPSLLAMGLGFIAAGIAIDFLLMGLAPGLRGTCRLVLVPRRGPALAIEGLDATPTDRALDALKP